MQASKALRIKFVRKFDVQNYTPNSGKLRRFLLCHSMSITKLSERASKFSIYIIYLREFNEIYLKKLISTNKVTNR